MMRYGLTQHTLEQIINIFTQFYKVEEVILYGSRAMGNYREGSDIDLALKGKELDMAELLKISAKLDELDLPYHFDLLIFEKIENRDLIDHICRVGKTIYG
ncbi:MAG: nucleotidyltransferase domain-containing protein [Fermentimonas sp.]|nr:nucleotidyltransferase domain-containing protein [Fermentimonas sp.]